jgi:hypothetical protein
VLRPGSPTGDDEPEGSKTMTNQEGHSRFGAAELAYLGDRRIHPDRVIAWGLATPAATDPAR